MYQKKAEKSLPEWLWFFLLLPIVLVVALLYKRGRIPRLPVRRAEAPRYVEPDSIPLNMGGAHSAAAPYIGDEEDEALGRMSPVTTELVLEEAPSGVEPRDADGETPVDVAEEQERAARRGAEGGKAPTQSEALANAAADEATGMAAAPSLSAEETQPAAGRETGEQDDLKIIEGIGPAIAGILRENGIRTFRQLADAKIERLTEILTAASLNRLADPATWPEQAALAADGKWDDLKTLQGSLKAGRRRQ